MNRRSYIPACILLLAFMAAAPTWAGGNDWTQWSGPNFDLTIRDSDVFDQPEFGLERIWVRPLGSAYSGVVVVGEKLVTASSDGTSDLLVALDAATGKEIWRYRIGNMYKGHDGSHDGPNGTPLVYGGRVYGLGPLGRLFAVRLEDGKEVFAHQVDEEYGAKAPDHGFTTAPTLVDGVLVVQTGGSVGHSISGFHPDTGELLWQMGDDSVDYQSPMAFELEGSTLALAVTSENILGLMPQTGEVLFRHALPKQGGYVAAQPIPLGDGKVLLTGRRLAGLYQVGKTDDGYEVTELWTSRSLHDTYTIPVPYEGYIYGYSRNFLTCVDDGTGETVWTSRPPGQGTIVLVDGHLVIQASSGDLVVVKASPEGYQEESRVKSLDGNTLTAPTFADGKFYVRDLSQIASIGVVDHAVADAVEAPKPKVEIYGRFAQFIGRVKATPSVEAKEKMIAKFLGSQKTFPIVEEDRWVHLVYQGDVKDLALSGNFLPWDEDERVMGRIEGTDFYYRSVEVTPAAHYTYRFRVFGEPRLDPRNSRSVEAWLTPWSELAMPGWPEPKHIEEPTGPRGRIETLTWASNELGKRDVKVYLPAGYDKSSDRYPLLVVNDGDEALRFGKMVNTLDNLVGVEVAPIVVAFVPSGAFSEYGSVAGLTKLTEAMVSELLPELESRYRLLTEPGSGAIMGTTFGASHAVYAALKHPEVFGQVAVQSYFAFRSKGEVAAMLEQGNGKGLRVFVELNTNDLHILEWADADNESRDLVERLRRCGAEVTTHEVADGPDWSSWRSRTDMVLQSLFPRSRVFRVPE